MSAEPDTDVSSVDFQCPTCTDSFPSQKSMKIHHVKTHGNRIVDLATCNTCGETFEPDANSKGKYCSRPCANEGARNRLEKTCQHCDDVFEVVPAEDDRKYCSPECFNETRERQRFQCPGCGLSHDRYETDYCSRTCHAEVRNNRPRPDDLDMLLWLLCVYEDHNIKETYRRANCVLDDHITLDRVRENLIEQGAFEPSFRTQLVQKVENGEIELDDHLESEGSA